MSHTAVERLRAAALVLALAGTAVAQPAPGTAEAAQATARAGQAPATQAPQPPPFTAPAPPMPAAGAAPGQEQPPQQATPTAMPNAPLPQGDRSTIDLRSVPALAAQPASPKAPAPATVRVEESKTRPAGSPERESSRLRRVFFPYFAPRVPPLDMASPLGADGLIRDGRLYLSLHDAITLALKNNLSVEVSRYDLALADTDLLRAQGGGTLRGLDYTVVSPPPGVGAATSPLLISASTTGAASPASVNVTDLSQIQQIGSSVQSSLSENGTGAYSTGPNLPLFDPVVTGEAGYFRRSDESSLLTTSGTGTGSSGTGTTETTPGAQSFVSAALDYQQGFSTGAQLEAYGDNAAEVLYAANSQGNPFHAPTTSLTLTQPLLRGRGPEVNLRFVHIAQLDQKVSRLVLEQQLLETVYGVSRLYYDLVSLGENVGVKQEALGAAQRLYEDDRNQVNEGTLAPIELTRVQALVSSSRLDLIQAQGEYRQQEVLLRENLFRLLGDAPVFTAIVPTDKIAVPQEQDEPDVPALTADALARRPDLAQAALQVRADSIAVRGSRNNVEPALSVYANVQTRGSTLAPLESLGSPGTGQVTPPTVLTTGGLRLETIYQGGVQLNMPLRNRIAQADAARDTIQLRQAQGRTAQLENDIRQQIENAAEALDTAHQAYAAAVESRNYQTQLLQAEIDKFSVGESTNYLVIQDQAYLAQARSTEVAARSDWMKARLALDRALGDLLERNNITVDDAIRGQRP